MRTPRGAAPTGYSSFTVGNALVVALTPLANAIREALAAGTLYDYAARHPAARRYAGRGVVYAAPLPSSEAVVVVRRSRHGGLFAPLTGDRFSRGTRAPRELRIALRLAALGVPTPQLVAYATYPAGLGLRRADVLTREVPNAADLATRLTRRPEASARAVLFGAAESLLAQLSRAGVRHPDLNLKNVLIAEHTGDGGLEPFVLDVDRIRFDTPGARAVTDANLRRFARSARKWRESHGAPISDLDLALLADRVRASLVVR
ncbi:MAG: lipopolysaccharide kinase InaA family protein [Gemmatimonadaceae bacterium]